MTRKPRRRPRPRASSRRRPSCRRWPSSIRSITCGRNPASRGSAPARSASGIEGKPASSGSLHAEQEYTYHRPLRAGEVLTSEVKQGAVWEKESKRAGKLIFRERITEHRDANGELVVTARSVGVTTERPVDAG